MQINKQTQCFRKIEIFPNGRIIIVQCAMAHLKQKVNTVQ